jgi:hypothetical protein
MRVVSIDMPYIPLHFLKFKKKLLTDPGPLNNKKRFSAAQQLCMLPY